MCGEQQIHLLFRLGCQGSPPRVRGTVISIIQRGPPRRITPACAGNSMSENMEADRAQDHPRVCGEQPVSNETGNPAWGSPPRVRGTEQPQPVGAGNQRITPACAGNRLILPPAAIEVRDHPRVCGEQPRIFFRLALQEGSPPRVRGTVTAIVAIEKALRITPACAGNSPDVFPIPP